MPDDIDPNEAAKLAETFQRHEADPSKWEEAEAVTGRPNDLAPGEQVRNSTLAERAKAVKARPEVKVVEGDDAENKAVQAADKKKAAPARRARKSK